MQKTRCTERAYVSMRDKKILSVVLHFLKLFNCRRRETKEKKAGKSGKEEEGYCRRTLTGRTGD